MTSDFTRSLRLPYLVTARLHNTSKRDDNDHNHSHEHEHGHEHEHEHGHDHSHDDTVVVTKQKSGASLSPSTATAEAEDPDADMEDMFIQGPAGIEWGGPTRGGKRPEPTRYGDWERKGRATDFK